MKALSDESLTDDPAAGLDALLSALEAGAATDELARAPALAAAQRVLHFHIQNEFSDWDAVHHTFTYANALHQLLRRFGQISGASFATAGTAADLMRLVPITSRWKTPFGSSALVCFPKYRTLYRRPRDKL